MLYPHRIQAKTKTRGGDLDSDEAKTRSKRTKEQVQAKNRNKDKTRTETRATPSNQTRRQAGGLKTSLYVSYSLGRFQAAVSVSDLVRTRFHAYNGMNLVPSNLPGEF